VTPAGPKGHDAARFRWLVLAVFVLSSAINYLDRQSLATLAPLIRAEFHLSNTQYGLILAAFSIAYMASAPFAGMLIDGIGLNRAISLAVGLWSCAGISTGFTRGLGGLVGCRAVLGVAESAGIPAAGKAIHQYLQPAERALGNAVNQAGVSLGLILAPPIATWLAMHGGWRQAFVVTGALGLAWIPLWNWAARRATPPAPAEEEKRGTPLPPFTNFRVFFDGFRLIGRARQVFSANY
jgi:ACS family hexuronate transporter-like MFS transporter